MEKAKSPSALQTLADERRSPVLYDTFGAETSALT